MVPDLRWYVLQPGVRGALQAKYWRELDSVARKWTDFELLCRTPLRNVSKSFILGLASEYVLRVHGRSVSLGEVVVRRYRHCGTSVTSCLVCTVCPNIIHVVMVLYGGTSAMGASVPVRRFCVGTSQ